jgi:ABC-type oligopeptide transport system substrate-binding subunit
MTARRLITLLGMAVILLATPLAQAERYLNLHTNAEPETLDSNLATGNVESSYIMSLFEGLTNYNPKDLSPRPGVAEKWTASPDGKIYTFSLRKDAKWSDGTPVTAQDFVYSYERLLNPKTGGKFATMLYPLKNGEAYNMGKVTDPKLLGVKAKDPATLILEFEYPVPYVAYLTSHMTYMPVPRQAIEKHGGNWTRPENIVSNGPFILKDWTPHKYATVVRNPHYWNKAAVKLDGIRFWPVEDLETALKMYNEGQLDLAWYLPSSKVPVLKTRPDFVKAPWFTTEYYWVNVKNPILKDPRVRRALAMAIDRKVLTERFLHGMSDPLSSFTPKGIPGYTAPSNTPQFNPEAARKLLKEAGITDPATVTVEILYNTHEQRKTVAQVVQQMWKQNLGITVQLHNEEWKSWIRDMQQKTYPGVCRAGWVGDYLDPMTFLDMLPTTSPANYSNWSNPKYDELIAKARMEPNAQKRMQLLSQAEAILMDEMPIIPLFQQSKDYLIKPYVKGHHSNLLDTHPWDVVSLEGAPTAATAAAGGGIDHWSEMRSLFHKNSK